ncbi:MAG: hypothetical protein IKF97_06765 [Clostridia bacterium]|nr:hypothetical protein [Clostridia bacterium]
MSILNYLMNKILPKNNTKELTEQELLNVIDIRGNFLYTRDNKIFIYIKINPINLQLWSVSELKEKLITYTAEFSSEDVYFSLYSISRPIELSGVIANYEKLRKSSQDLVQKRIISNTINYLQSMSSVGDAIEKQTYVILWKEMSDYAEKDLLKRANEWIKRFQNVSSNARILNEHEIVQLINGFTNPNVAYDEDVEGVNRFSDLSRIKVKGEL